MGNKNISGVGFVALILIMLIVSVVLGLVIGLFTLEWWKELMFEGVYGAPVIAVIVIPVAFLVPFLGILLAQLYIWFFIKRSKSKKTINNNNHKTF